MPRLDLAGLQQARGLTLEQLRVQSPQVAAQLAPLIQTADGDRLIAALSLPDDVRARIGALDTSKGADDVIMQLRARLAALQVPAAQIDQFVTAANGISDRLKTADVPGVQPMIGKQI